MDPSHFGEEREILHVAGTDLEHVRVGCDQLHLSRVHHLRDDREPGRGPHFGQDLQAFFGQAVEAVGGSSSA